MTYELMVTNNNDTCTEGVVMANFNTNHTVVPLVASMLCLLDIPAHTFVRDVALVVDNTDPNGKRSNEM